MNKQPKFSIFWYRWFLFVIIGVMLFGISMVIIPSLILKLFSLLIYSNSNTIESEFSLEAVKYIELVHGVLGAVMFGWGTLLLVILIGPFKNGSIDGWYYLATSVIAWFVPDTLFSLWKGFWQNAILNSILLSLLTLPLIATYNAFIKQRKQ